MKSLIILTSVIAFQLLNNQAMAQQSRMSKQQIEQEQLEIDMANDKIAATEINTDIPELINSINANAAIILKKNLVASLSAQVVSTINSGLKEKEQIELNLSKLTNDDADVAFERLAQLDNLLQTIVNQNK